MWSKKRFPSRTVKMVFRSSFYTRTLYTIKSKVTSWILQGNRYWITVPCGRTYLQSENQNQFGYPRRVGFNYVFRWVILSYSFSTLMWHTYRNDVNSFGDGCWSSLIFQLNQAGQLSNFPVDKGRNERAKIRISLHRTAISDNILRVVKKTST